MQLDIFIGTIGNASERAFLLHATCQIQNCMQLLCHTKTKLNRVSSWPLKIVFFLGVVTVQYVYQRGIRNTCWALGDLLLCTTCST